MTHPRTFPAPHLYPDSMCPRYSLLKSSTTPMPLPATRFILIISIFLFPYLAPSNTYADSEYNPFTHRWELTSPCDELQYNTMERTWSYAPKNSTEHFNPFTNKWELGTEHSELEYNSFENRWERAEPGEELEYDSLVGEWGYGG